MHFSWIISVDTVIWPGACAPETNPEELKAENGMEEISADNILGSSKLIRACGPVHGKRSLLILEESCILHLWPPSVIFLSEGFARS